MQKTWLGLLAVVIAAWPAVSFAASCAPCERTFLLCRECNTFKKYTEKCVNKQPSCSGCDTVTDTQCEEGGEPKPEEEHQTLIFDPGEGRWRLAESDTVAQTPVTSGTCGSVPTFTIY